MSHLKFQGIELNGSIENFINKLETKGYTLSHGPFGKDVKIAQLRGEYADYHGLCSLSVAATHGNVYTMILEGEDCYSVDNVLDDFKFFKQKAESYNIELIGEEDDYFDENDVDDIRDGNVKKEVMYKQEDGSGIHVSVSAGEEDDTFHVTMMFFDGKNSGDINKINRSLENYTESLKECIAQYDSDHLVFNGVEMNCDISDFVEELEKKGFRTTKNPQPAGEIGGTIAAMQGQFMGEPCELMLLANNYDEITEVFVTKKERKSFDVVKKEFYKLFDAYKQKYGEPCELQEGLLLKDDPLDALRNNEDNLAASFSVGERGSRIAIIVNIDEDSHFPHIVLTYLDGINSGNSNSTEDDFDIDDIDNLDMDDYYDDI